MSQRHGWYDDPDDPTQLRYFDGVIWTQNRQPKKSPTAAQSSIGRPPAPTPGPYAGGSGPSSPPPQKGMPPQLQWGHPPQQGMPPQQPWNPSQPPQQPYGYGPAYGTGYAGAGVKATPDGVPVASWGRRLGAWLLDALITLVVTGVIGIHWVSQIGGVYADLYNDAYNSAAGGGQVSPFAAAEQYAPQLESALLPLLGVLGVVVIAYQLVFLAWKQATPGKMASGLVVRPFDEPGSVPLGRLLLRVAAPTLVFLASQLPLAGILFLLFLLDYLWPLWDPRGQSLHDKLARTAVVPRTPYGR